MDVTEASFETEVLAASADAPVVVDFWADWCAPCKALGPLLEAATDAKGIKLAKIDTDANQTLSAEFGIRGIPAVKAFRNGHVVSEFVGVQSAATIDAFLEKLLEPPVAESVDDAEIAEALGANDYERAFTILLERAETDPEQRDAVRELMVRLFGELGHEHPLTVEFRRKLATAIY
jgi:putative thioredoxin